MPNNVYKGLDWALTPKAKEEIAELVRSGLDFDLAFALVDHQVLTGERPEADVYLIEPANETARHPRQNYK